MGSLITAVRILTRLPVPGGVTKDEAGSLAVFPLVGALIGGLISLISFLVGGLLEWPAGAGAAGAVAAAWITGGLHLDGLGDTVDGLYGGRTCERRLEIMKDTCMGAFGTVAVVLAILVKAVSLSRLALLSGWSWIVIPFVLARMNLVLLSAALPYARAEGGTARNIVTNANARHVAAAVITALVLCWAAARGPGLGAFAVSCVIALVLGRWMKRMFGGVTGDLLGMANELTECILLFAAAIAVT